MSRAPEDGGRCEAGWCSDHLAASDGFTALASDRSDITRCSMRAIVQAAISGILIQQGHTVAEPATEDVRSSCPPEPFWQRKTPYGPLRLRLGDDWAGRRIFRRARSSPSAAILTLERQPKNAH